MTAVPRTEAAAITDARNRLAHFAGPVDLDQVQHPLVTASCEERAELVMSLARLAPGTPFASVCERFAEAIRQLELMDVPAAWVEHSRKRELMMAGEVMRFVQHAWSLAGQIDDLQAGQDALCGRGPRTQRVLRKARIPLWVVNALKDIDPYDLRSMTAVALLDLADFKDPELLHRGERSRDAFLAEAASALQVLRVLTILNVEPAAWNELLERLDARLEAAERPDASRVGEVAVPPRPCRPPGELVLAEPRVPRAPGCVAPRRSIDMGRRRVQRWKALASA